MSDKEQALAILTKHKDKLDQLVYLLDGLDVCSNQVKSIEVVVTDRTNQTYGVEFDGDWLDTVLVFKSLMSLAKTRSEYLETKQKELRKYVQGQI